MCDRFEWLSAFHGSSYQWQIQGRRRHIGPDLYTNRRLYATIAGYHTIVVTFYRPRKWLFWLVELCHFSGKNHNLRALYIINSENVWRGSQKMAFSQSAQLRALLVSKTISNIYKKDLKETALINAALKHTDHMWPAVVFGNFQINLSCQPFFGVSRYPWSPLATTKSWEI